MPLASAATPLARLMAVLRGAVRAMRASRRLLQVLLTTAAGWFTIVWLFPRLNPRQREARVQAWATRMLAAMGVALRVHGQPPAAGPVLLVANHLSWLDILVLHAARPCRFVAKADIHRWPVVGTLATGAGTLYIERASRRDALRVVHRMADALRAGEVVAVFPEGTTGDGVTLLPFHANLLQAALSTGAPALAVALCFKDSASGRPSTAPLYLDGDSLLRSVWRTLAAPPLVAELQFGCSQPCPADGRRQWAADLREEVGKLKEALHARA